MVNNVSKVRPPAWAGMFYPRRPDQLTAKVKMYLAQADRSGIDGRITGIIAPHAGYDYSGPTAAAAYKLVQNQAYDAVVVIAPSHHEFIKGVSVYNGEAYQTPLGAIQIDRELSEAIAGQNDVIQLSDLGHRAIGQDSEHSLEVQLPFLQLVFGDQLKIVAIVFHKHSYEICEKLGKAIANASRNKNILLVASSDLYHGYSYDELKITDSRTLAAIKLDGVSEFCNGLESGIFMACGGGPIAALLTATRELGSDSIKVIARTNSADVTGSRGGWTVGYASIVVFKKSNL